MVITKRTYTIDNSDVAVQAVIGQVGQLYAVNLGMFGHKGEVVVNNRDLLDLIAILEGIAKDYNLYEKSGSPQVEPVNTSAARMPMLEELTKHGQVPTMGVPTHREDETAS